MVVVNMFVIPQFAKVFASLHTELPLMTRILMAHLALHGRLLAAACW